MTLLAITEIGSRSGGLKMEGLQRTYTRTYQVFTSGAAVEPLEIMTQTTAGGVRLPRIGEYYVGASGYYDAGAIVDDIQCEQPHDDHPDYWLVNVVWRSFPSNLVQNTQGSGGGSPGVPQSSNPLFQPPKVDWNTRKIMKPLRLTTIRPTLSGVTLPSDLLMYNATKANPVVNTAGTFFDPPPQNEISFRTLEIVRNEPQFRPFTTNLYVNTVNLEIFQNQPPGCAFCDDINASYGFQDSVAFFAVTYRFSFAPLRDDGSFDPFFWYPQMLNRGPRYLSAPAGGYIQPLGELADEGGQLVEYNAKTGVGGGQVFLSPQGTLLAGFDKNNGRLAPTARPYSIVFPNRQASDFGELNLPDPAYL